MARCETEPNSLHCVLSCLASLASHNAGCLAPLVPDLLQLVTRLSEESARLSLVLVLTLLLQTHRAHSWSPSVNQSWQQQFRCFQRKRTRLNDAQEQQADEKCTAQG